MITCNANSKVAFFPIISQKSLKTISYPTGKVCFPQWYLRSGQGLAVIVAEKSSITNYISNIYVCICQEQLVTAICEVARDTVIAMKRSAIPIGKFIFPDFISEVAKDYLRLQ